MTESYAQRNFGFAGLLSVLVLCCLILVPSLTIGIILDDSVQLAWGKAVVDQRIDLWSILCPGPEDPYGGKSYFYFRPLHWLTFVFLWLVFKLDFLAQHAVLVGCHLAMTIVFFSFVKSYTGRADTAVVACLLFAINLGTVENTCWISCQTTIIATLFHLLAVQSYYLYCRSTKLLYYILALVCFLLALFTNEASSMTIFVLLFLELSKEGMSENTTIRFSFGTFVMAKVKTVLKLCPHLILTGIFLSFRGEHIQQLFPDYDIFLGKCIQSFNFVFTFFFGYWHAYQPGEIIHILHPSQTIRSLVFSDFVFLFILVPLAGVSFRYGLKELWLGIIGFLVMTIPFVLLWPFTPRYMYGTALYLAIIAASMLIKLISSIEKVFWKRMNPYRLWAGVLCLSLFWALFQYDGITSHIQAMQTLGTRHGNILEQLPPPQALQSFEHVILYKFQGNKRKKNFPPRYLGYLNSPPLKPDWYDFSHPFVPDPEKSGLKILALANTQQGLRIVNRLRSTNQVKKQKEHLQ